MMVRLIVAATLIALAMSPAAAQGTADDAGKRAFVQCRACHTLDAGGRNLNGPNLHGLFGATAGSKPGFVYSAAMAKAGFVWTEQQLDTFLADPRTTVRGNKMMFAGVKDPKTRQLLIAYLKAETASRTAS